ncbi:MAG: DNA polymerase III subunit delta [Neisseriaceae bacterium]
MNLTLDNFFKLDNHDIPHLFLIHASEEYTAVKAFCTNFIKGKLTKIDTTLEANFNQIKTYKFDIDRYFNFDQVLDIIRSPSLFDEINYIELNYKTKPKEEHQECFSKLYKDLSNSNTLVITCDLLNKNELKANWLKEFDTHSGNVIMLNESSIIPLINHILEQNSLSIAPDALKILISQNESNITQLLQELNTLILYYPSGTRIDYTDIQNNTNDNAKYNIYQLSNAYLSGNLETSISMLDNIYNKTEDAILINWIFSEDVKKLLKIKSKLRANSNINQCMREAGVWGDSTKFFPSALNRISYKSLINILKMLSQLDFMIKGVVDGDIKNQITKILIEITRK